MADFFDSFLFVDGQFSFFIFGVFCAFYEKRERYREEFWVLNLYIDFHDLPWYSESWQSIAHEEAKSCGTTKRNDACAGYLLQTWRGLCHVYR